MAAAATHEQQVSMGATTTPPESDITPTKWTQAAVHEERPRAQASTPPCLNGAGSACMAEGQSREEAIVLPADSESESEDEATPRSDMTLPSINAIIAETPESICQESTVTTVPNTPRAAPSSLEIDDDFNRAVRHSPGHTSPSPSFGPRQDSMHGADLCQRSTGFSTAETTGRDHLPVVPQAASIEDADEPPSTGKGTTTPLRVTKDCNRRESGNRAKLRRQTRPYRSASQRDSIPTDSDGDATNDGDGDSGSEYDDDSNSDTGSDESADDSGHGTQRNAECSPSVPDSDDSRLGEPRNNDTDESSPRPHKRQKVANDLAAKTSVSHRNSMLRSSVRSQSRSPRNRRTAIIPSPPASPGLSEPESEDGHDCRKASEASFGEWRLQNAALKCVTINGVTTYQLQFQRAQAHTSDWQETRLRNAASTMRASRARMPTRFSDEENHLLTQLKTRGGLTWKEIHQHFDEEFPGRRSLGTLQVHYSTKLRSRSQR